MFLRKSKTCPYFILFRGSRRIFLSNLLCLVYRVLVSAYKKIMSVKSEFGCSIDFEFIRTQFIIY